MMWNVLIKPACFASHLHSTISGAQLLLSAALLRFWRFRILAKPGDHIASRPAGGK